MSTIPIRRFRDWNKLLTYYRTSFDPLEQWVFRGQADANWTLQTKLERELSRYRVNISQAPAYEQAIIRQFIRVISNYQPTAKLNHSMECLSFIQHFGGPTRLMDWSYSFYIGAFFALVDARIGSDAAIWCFKSGAWDLTPAKPSLFGKEALNAMQADPYKKEPKTHSLVYGVPMIDGVQVLASNPDANPCVVPVASFFSHNRIIRQQGMFVAQTVLNKTYEENLLNMLTHKSFKGSIVKIVVNCNKRLLTEALIDLRRMSLTYESLFDEVGYFCRSLGIGIIDRYPLITSTHGKPAIPRKRK